MIILSIRHFAGRANVPVKPPVPYRKSRNPMCIFAHRKRNLAGGFPARQFSAMASNTVPALILGSLIGIGSPPAQASTDFSQCGLPTRVTMTKSLADIPSAVLARMPGLGAADEPILSDEDDPSDPISDSIPTGRLAEAFSEGARWAVVYETGDFANTRMVALFSVTQGKASLIKQQAASQEIGVCAILKTAFLDHPD
jgi:hypothetical protein